MDRFSMLLRMAEDQNGDFRQLAAIDLAHYDDLAAIDCLSDMLDDELDIVASAAKASLEAIYARGQNLKALPHTATRYALYVMTRFRNSDYDRDGLTDELLAWVLQCPDEAMVAWATVESDKRKARKQ